jgi:hypothetical protein
MNSSNIYPENSSPDKENIIKNAKIQAIINNFQRNLKLDSNDHMLNNAVNNLKKDINKCDMVLSLLAGIENPKKGILGLGLFTNKKDDMNVFPVLLALVDVIL